MFKYILLLLCLLSMFANASSEDLYNCVSLDYNNVGGEISLQNGLLKITKEQAFFRDELIENPQEMFDLLVKYKFLSVLSKPLEYLNDINFDSGLTTLMRSYERFNSKYRNRNNADYYKSYLRYHDLIYLAAHVEDLKPHPPLRIRRGNGVKLHDRQREYYNKMIYQRSNYEALVTLIVTAHPSSS